MNPNPFTDVLSFLTQAGWPTVIFWLLLAGSIGIAVFAYRTIPGQNTFAHFGNWGFRRHCQINFCGGEGSAGGIGDHAAATAFLH